jgi:UDP-N-acetylglucosamine:LPS N-acetylglucosamine transferase
VKSYLARDYDVVMVDTSSPTGFAKKDTAIYVAANYFFNEIAIKRRFYKLSNNIDKAREALKIELPTACPAPGCNFERKNRYRAVLLRERPDVVVTVFPMELLVTLEVAKDVGNVPVLHLATDLDLKFREVFGSTAPVYPRFRVGVPFPLPQSLATVVPLSEAQTFISGYPVRPAFLKAPDDMRIAATRRSLLPSPEFALSGGDVLALVMTGGSGQYVAWPEVLAYNGLAGFSGRVHVMVVAGKNNLIQSRYDKIFKRSRNVTATKDDGPKGRYVWDARGYGHDVMIELLTDAAWSDHQKRPFFVRDGRLADLMDASDVVVTKPGGSTTAEIAYRGTPAVYDAVDGLFSWEHFAVGLFEEKRRGVILENKRRLGEAMMEAIQMGKDRSVAMEAGKLLATPTRVRSALDELQRTTCDRCAAIL